MLDLIDRKIIKVVSWNSHSLDDIKREMMFEFLERNEIPLIGIAETWKMNDEKKYDCKISGWRATGFNHKSGRRGLGSFAHTNLKLKYLEPYCLQTEWMTMITGRIGKVVVVFVYVANGSRFDGIEEVLDKLGLLAMLYKDIVVLGDLNARMGLLEDESTNAAGR